MNFAEIVFSIIGLIVAIIIGFGQIRIAKRVKDFEVRQDKRDEERRKNELFARATKFIQKHNKNSHDSDILLLPLCVAAYKYNPAYPYRREIYRDFCSLTEEVQNEILKRCGLNLVSKRCSDYYAMILQNIKSTIENNYKNDRNIFYDNGRYFERALLNSGERIVPTITCEQDEEERAMRESSFGALLTDRYYMDYESHVTNLLAYHKDEKPICLLMTERTNMGTPESGEEILMSYLCCMIAKYATIYSHRNGENTGDTGYVCDYTGERYMEDVFLDALHSVDNYNR